MKPLETPALAMIDTPDAVAFSSLHFVKPTPAMKKTAPKKAAKPQSPELAMIDTPEDGSFYLLPPVNLDGYNPAIRVHAGEIFPCYVVPSRIGGVFSQGGRQAVRRWRELEGIQHALEIMGAVWSGLLKSYPGASDDLARQKNLAEGLMGPPDISFALIEKSGARGKSRVPKKAAFIQRNVMALAHWGAIWEIREVAKSKTVDGGPRPGAIHWKEAAALMNRICHEKMPESRGAQWTGFTPRSLEKLADRWGLSFESGA